MFSPVTLMMVSVRIWLSYIIPCGSYNRYLTYNFIN
jgi:hypothetical protein